jgi:hypothetical protein
MRRYLTLVCVLCLAIPAGISFSGCSRDPGANYCNGLGYGLKITDVAGITLQPRTTGISLAFGQTRQLSSPTAITCKGTSATVTGAYQYGSTNRSLVDITPAGNLCAGTWNRNSGGGIADYTICSFPNPLPNSGGLPFNSAFVTVSADSVVSNPVQVYVHPQVTSVSLVGPTSCQSQGQVAQLDAQACYSANVNGTPTNSLLCAPSTVTDPSLFACPLPPGIATVPSCSSTIGTLTYVASLSTVATIDPITNQITAQHPGTTAITASVAGSGSSAGYFTTCPPQSISVTLANGSTSGTVNHSATQNLVTNVIDTQGNSISGLTLDYQSTDPIDISVNANGAVATSYPGEAAITAICQPPNCNPAPINEFGRFGTGLAITSNPVSLTYQGANSNYVWFAAPGQSQYVVPVQLLSGTVGSTTRLPFVPNSMIMDRLGNNLYFGSEHELMIYSTASNSVTKQDNAAPGVVLAVAPNNGQLLINDQVLGKFYIYAPTTGVAATFPGLGSAASWSPDSKTLWVSDSAALGGGHTDTLYVYNAGTGWTTYPLPCSTGPNCADPSLGAQSLVVTIPSVGAYMAGSPTVAHTWCPSGTVGNYASMSFYPQGDVVYLNPPQDTEPVQTDVLAATTDGSHILGAALINAGVKLSDIQVDIPSGACPSTTTGVPPNQVQTLEPLIIAHQVEQAQLDHLTQVAQTNGATLTAVDQVVASPASNLAFITYNATPNNVNAVLPYYKPVPGYTGTLGTVGYVTLSSCASTLSTGAANPAWPCPATDTAPIAGAFTPDDSLFFVSTAGDNLIHYISLPSLTDTQQIAPGLPACTPPSAGGKDDGCLYPGTDAVVPATAIAVKPRTTT